jgi:hypothetical protein
MDGEDLTEADCKGVSWLQSAPGKSSVFVDTMTKMSYKGFEVFTAVVMKSIIFWDMTPCSLLSFNRCFEGTYRLHLQGRRNRFGKPASKQVASRP